MSTRKEDEPAFWIHAVSALLPLTLAPSGTAVFESVEPYSLLQPAQKNNLSNTLSLSKSIFPVPLSHPYKLPTLTLPNNNKKRVSLLPPISFPFLSSLHPSLSPFYSPTHPQWPLLSPVLPHPAPPTGASRYIPRLSSLLLSRISLSSCSSHSFFISLPSTFDLINKDTNQPPFYSLHLITYSLSTRPALVWYILTPSLHGPDKTDEKQLGQECQLLRIHPLTRHPPSLFFPFLTFSAWRQARRCPRCWSDGTFFLLNHVQD